MERLAVFLSMVAAPTDRTWVCRLVNQIGQWVVGAGLGGAIALIPVLPTPAQITPDRSLGDERSVVRTGRVSDRPADLIEGGARRGANLFHSFSSFNIDAGQRTYFTNPNGVERIFSRVTGTTRSSILGTLGVLGTADLFLLNPNGILFGPNATLDISGSFVATTAEAIEFRNQPSFSAIDPQAPPLLTLSAPIGLQLGAQPGRLTVRGVGHNITYNSDTSTLRRDSLGLRVGDGQTLALIGGDLTLRGGNLRTDSGQIVLGSIAQPGLVQLSERSNGFTFNYSAIDQFGEIRLLNRASADASGAGGGEIRVQGGRVALRDGSAMLSITEGAKNGAFILVNADQSVQLIGAATDGSYLSSLTSENQGSGAARGVTVNTDRLIATDGGNIETFAYSTGDGGDLTVNATQSVTVAREGNYPFSGGFYTGNSGFLAGTGTNATGDSGRLSVNTSRLVVQDRGLIISTTSGAGAGGTLTIRANDVKLRRVGQISSATAGTNQGGDLTIRTQRLSVDAGAQIVAGTFSNAAGGDLTILADRIDVSGVDPNDTFSSGLFSQSNIGLDGDPTVTGTAGDLTITTRQLSIRGGAVVSAANRGQGRDNSLTIRASERVEVSGVSPLVSFPSTLRASGAGNGEAGNLAIATPLLLVNDGANVAATTQAGRFGNILVQSDAVVLSRGGTITTDATGTAQGGNITLTADVLTLANDSAVIARAIEGRGGNIRITTSGLLQSPESAIDASSQRGIDGVVEINTPEFDPTQGTSELPTAFSAPPLAQGCQTTSRTSRFVNAGRGGVPINPTDPLTATPLWQDWSPTEISQEPAVEPPDTSDNDAFSAPVATPNPISPLVEAQSWISHASGKTELVAQSLTAVPLQLGESDRCY